MPNPVTPEAAMKIVFELLQKVLPKLTDTPVTLEQTGDGDDCAVLLDGWIGIASTIVEVPAIGRKVAQRQYQIQVIVHDPGVYRYPDGSGQPPSDDLVDVGGPLAHPFDVVQKALELYQTNILKHILEGIATAPGYV